MAEPLIDTNKSLGQKVEALAYDYGQISCLRDPRLFTIFLVDGYKMTTLSSVPQDDFDQVIFAKVCLGMLITLYDDLADNPACSNSKVLKELYQLNIGFSSTKSVRLTRNEKKIYEFALMLFEELEKTICLMPHFALLSEVLTFDIKQIFLANHYAELMSARPEIRNLRESKELGPYNMGMVAAGMIDLMASPGFHLSELGRARELLIQGQRLGRIGNLINTFDRELTEGDVTNEMLLYPEGIEASKNLLIQELALGLGHVRTYATLIKSLSIGHYAQGLSDLFQLHSLMKGII